MRAHAAIIAPDILCDRGLNRFAYAAGTFLPLAELGRQNREMATFGAIRFAGGEIRTHVGAKAAGS